MTLGGRTSWLQRARSGIGGALLLLSLLLNVIGLRDAVVYFLIGTPVCLAFSKSGMHATLASVLLALTIPARSHIRGEPFVQRSLLPK